MFAPVTVPFSQPAGAELAPRWNYPAAAWLLPGPAEPTWKPRPAPHGPAREPRVLASPPVRGPRGDWRSPSNRRAVVILQPRGG